MSASRQKNILLVEDNLLAALITAGQLEKLGYRVITASSGEEAVETVCAEKEPVDLVLMDIDLGAGIDGPETAQRILDEYDLPVVFLSAHTAKEILDKIDRITSYGYVAKDSSVTVLDASLKMAFKLFESKLNERTRAKALQESEQLFHALFEKNQAVKLLIDPDMGTIIDANSAASRFYGYSLPKLRTMKISDITIQSMKLIEDEMADAVSEKKSYFNFSHRLAGGEIREVEVYTSPITIGGRILLHSITHDITDRKRDEAEIKNLLIEKELILKEVHHRIKNNMNTIFGLLTLQASSKKNLVARDLLADSASRVQSMMVLYDKLYRSDNTNAVSLKYYIPALVNEIVGIFPRNDSVSIRTKIEDLSVKAATLSSLGIIINELITNSMKYAFSDRIDGVLSVSAYAKDDWVVIDFQDNGIGIPESKTFEQTSGFGMQLIKGLVAQIHGTIRIERPSTGSRFIIEFPK